MISLAASLCALQALQFKDNCELVLVCSDCLAQNADQLIPT